MATTRGRESRILRARSPSSIDTAQHERLVITQHAPGATACYPCRFRGSSWQDRDCPFRVFQGRLFRIHCDGLRVFDPDNNRSRFGRRSDLEMADCNRAVCNWFLPARKSTSIGVRLPRGASKRFAGIRCCTAYLRPIALEFEHLRREHYFPFQADWRSCCARIERDLQPNFVVGSTRGRRHVEYLAQVHPTRRVRRRTKLIRVENAPFSSWPCYSQHQRHFRPGPLEIRHLNPMNSTRESQLPRPR
jgi:hypothetical protein